MKLKKIVFLFLALLFPICIFIFLKLFGKNEFAVAPLYTDIYPEGVESCGTRITLPYSIPDSVQAQLKLKEDSLTLLQVGESKGESEKQLNRVENEFGDQLQLKTFPSTSESSKLKDCVFFLKDSYDLVLIDNRGVIRGQYISNDREDIDRLLTELAILLKRY